MLKMKQILVAALFTLGCSPGVFAQNISCESADWCKYLYVFGAGKTARTEDGKRLIKGSNGGAGFEAVHGNGIGVGFEAGGGFRDHLPQTNGVYGSLSLIYQRWVAERINLFGVGGVTGVVDSFESPSGNAGFHFGGGGNYWFHNKVAVRVEYRGQIFKHCGGCIDDTFRFGFTFADR
jgi:opacity protein-like surface antigen